MLKGRGGLDLHHEPVGAQHRGQLGPQHLECDLAIVLEIGGEVDGGHPALPQLPLDAVAIGQDGSESLRSVGQGCLGGMNEGKKEAAPKLRVSPRGATRFMSIHMY